MRSALTAGDAPTQPLMSGECARINTGASLPSGADCVVQVTLDGYNLHSGYKTQRIQISIRPNEIQATELQNG